MQEVEQVQQLMIEKGWTLSLAESCTGGAAAARLVELPGASRYFLGSIVAYSNGLKTSLLKVSSELIEQKGAVSEEVAVKMAEGALAVSGSDLSLSVTGIAGPEGGSSEKPVGTVWITLADKQGHVKSRKFVFGGSRTEVIRESVDTLFNQLLAYLEGSA